jgi:polyvinyl alcohol dehydrogenase (cytochrome)
MGRQQIHFALTEGKMRPQGQRLSARQLGTLIGFLAPSRRSRYNALMQGSEGTSNWCEDRSIDPLPLVASWGVAPGNTRFQADSEISLDNIDQLSLAWSFGLPDTSEVRSQPVITSDTLFVSTTSGHLFALARQTGCTKWHRDLKIPLRTPLTLGSVNNQATLFFGDARKRIHAVSASTGDTLWEQEVSVAEASMLTAGTVQYSNRLYVPISAMGVARAQNPRYECCKSHGAVAALDVVSGEILWTTHMTPEAKPTYKNSAGTQMWGPSGAPVWTTPTVDPDRNRLYVGTGENTSSPATDLSDAIVALDLDSGAIVWSYQATAGDAFNMACRRGPSCPREQGPDFDFGATPVLAKLPSGDEILVAGQKSGMVHALDPDDGRLIWQTELSQGTALGGVHWGISVSGQTVVVPISDPPIRRNFEPRPGVYGLNLADGKLTWSHRAARGCELKTDRRSNRSNPWPDCSYTYGFSAATTTNSEIAFSGAVNGHAYGIDLTSGKVVWQYDTVRAFDTVNGVKAHGGAIDNFGMQLAQDMLVIASGYGMFGQMPGNALLVFRLPDSD